MSDLLLDTCAIIWTGNDDPIDADAMTQLNANHREGHRTLRLAVFGLGAGFACLPCTAEAGASGSELVRGLCHQRSVRACRDVTAHSCGVIVLAGHITSRPGRPDHHCHRPCNEPLHCHSRPPGYWPTPPRAMSGRYAVRRVSPSIIRLCAFRVWRLRRD